MIPAWNAPGRTCNFESPSLNPCAIPYPKGVRKATNERVRERDERDERERQRGREGWSDSLYERYL